MENSDVNDIVALIERAFMNVEFPGADNLVDSAEGSEPRQVAKVFGRLKNWRRVSASILDSAPNGLGSALSFFSMDALMFFLPAYMIAGLKNMLRRADPVFALTWGLDDESRNEKVNPRRYGDMTWWQYKTCRWSRLTHQQVAAIVEYLRYMATVESDERQDAIVQALDSYWLPSCRGSP